MRIICDYCSRFVDQADAIFCLLLLYNCDCKIKNIILCALLHIIYRIFRKNMNDFDVKANFKF